MSDYLLLHGIAKIGIKISETRCVLLILCLFVLLFVCSNVCFNSLLSFRYAYDKSECGYTYSFYGSGIASYVYPLPEAGKILEAAFQFFKQVGIIIYRECQINIRVGWKCHVDDLH